jgi:23S rRNA pseudouridine1911/1915/1917 synthase
MQYKVTLEDVNMTVAGVLKKRFFFSRTLLRRVKRQSKVLINGQTVFLSKKVFPGDIVKVDTEFEKSSNVIPEKMHLDIIFEDSEILIINKPSDMLVHPTGFEIKGTLANGIMAHWLSQGKENPVIRPVFRIDRDTSGIVLFSANHTAHLNLLNQMKENTMSRYYLALVEGRMLQDRGTINFPIGIQQGSFIKREISAEGKPSVTHYRVLKYLISINATLLEVRLETGRTHQIRVHMASSGHPLLGDSLYGCGGGYIPRQGLHSHRIVFKHPDEGVEREFVAPIPQDILEALSIDQGLNICSIKDLL